LAFEGTWDELKTLAAAKGPAALAAATSEVDPTAIDRYLSGEDCQSPASFFARVMLRQDPPRRAPAPNRCPRCGDPPQCGCLRPEGHGSAFFLVCGLCAAEWRFPRAHCPACGEQAVFYSAERMPHVQTQVCEHCLRYLHVIDIDKDPAAVPLIDEVAALAMDVWARERGLSKIHPNLAGI
jgi:formate dehydrogenase accessory protein FdhE